MSCEGDETPPPIPKGCQLLSHQVAGHIYGKSKTRAGLLQDSSGSILKLLQTNNRGEREKRFYKTIFDEEQADPILRDARSLVCPFRGTVASAHDPSVEFIKLRDMTIGYKHPCIMDIKIGRIGYAEGGDSTKMQMSRRKYPDMEKLGFQVLGMRVFHPRSQKYTTYDKTYGKTLNIDNMIEGLAKFFNVDETIRTDVMYSFLVRLQQILDWFQVQARYHFYSSSLLFIYEGAVSPGDDAVKKPINLSQHSDGAFNGHADDIFSVKPDTYPLKRKKSSDCDDSIVDGDDCSGLNRGNKNQRENGIRTVDEGCESRTSVPLSSSKANDRVGVEVTHNTIIDRHEIKAGVNHVRENLGPSASLGGTVYGHERTRNNHHSCHVPTPNHSTHQLGMPVHANHRTDQSNVRETSRKDSDLPHDGANDHSPHHVEIRMIDFAHAIETTTRDENYIFGLKMLKQYIETLHNCHIW
ncbi:uncharacterized protein LOC121432089 [Lytechinus variegatus]|uniref:uncharacterized protein LOC121432089 n=1 Tax=Lytechinus variegatus TaxID=7654 RepID=UPI001BB20218|nr:uncharacterized protein LOC121432089 [Lytechinus variegatus]